MKTVPTTRNRLDQRGMTLIEILVSSALLLVITIGLTTMFNETQRAFRTSLKNADVYQGARATMDLVSRDLEQLSRGPSTNLHVVDTFIPPNIVVPPISAVMPDNSARLHDFCFLIQINNHWTGIGYKLKSPFLDNQVGVGELFRFTTNYPSIAEAGNLIRDFEQARPDQLSAVCNGVVHMRLLPFSVNGYTPYDPNGFTNIDSFPKPGTFVGANTNFFDFANCVPGYVELEMGLIEPQNFEQLKGLSVSPPATQIQYVIDHAHRVHVFRQQIPIRAAQR
jgi:prepilin-type N-terminal cleavage/methylation domain-containing protein